MIVSADTIDRVESILEFLSDVYNYTTERCQDIEAEPKHAYDEEKRKATRQELRKLNSIRTECSAQYYYWNHTLQYIKHIEQSEG